MSPVNCNQTLAVIDQAVEGNRRSYVCCAAVHSVLDAQRDPALRTIFNQSLLTTPDGMPLVWLCRKAGHAEVSRVYGPDLMLAACKHSVGRGYRHFFLGSQPEVVEALMSRLVSEFPGLSVAGWLCPRYPDPAPVEPDNEAVTAIRHARPDLVWVALGTGKQEHWMARHAALVEAPLMLGVGAAFDYIAGAKWQAPRWIMRAGLEWAFRLASEPRRLWRRYFEYPRFAWLMFLQASKLRSFPMDAKQGQGPS